MSRTKSQLVDSIINLLTNVIGNTITRENKQFLEGCTVAWLEEYLKVVNTQVADKIGTDREDKELQAKLDQIRLEAQREWEQSPERIRAEQEESAKAQAQMYEYYMTQIFSTTFNGKRPVRNSASERIICSWANLDEKINIDWFHKVLREQPELAEQIPWRDASIDPKAADRALFLQCARLYGYSANQANFGLIRSTLGEGFSQLDIENAINNQSVYLAPATHTELEQWAAVAIEERNQKLLTLGPNQLRAEAKRESADQRVQQEQKQAEDSLNASKERDAATAFPALPAEITREVIRAAESNRLRFWIQKYGNFNVTARLQRRG